MKARFPCFSGFSVTPRVFGVFVLAGVAGPVASAAQTYVAAEDGAHFAPYADGWQSGDRGGRGFGAWRLFAPEYGAAEGEEQYAGFFIAEAGREADLAGVAHEGRAFGIFANGTGFEETVAARAFDGVLRPGDVFTFRFKFDGFRRKFERDAENVSSVGLALRSSSQAAGLEDLTEGRMLVFAALQGLSTYQLLDAEPRFNTRVFLDPEGVEVTVRLREAARYDLEIRTLSDDRVHRLAGRRLRTGGESAADGPGVRGFALFNLNGGEHNAYFNAFQLLRGDGEAF
jgi:hypothetical protein